MIVRSWRGFAHHRSAAAYVQHLREDVLPVLDDIPGYQGIQILRRDASPGTGDAGDEDEVEVEFVVLTTWTSMDAIRRFAGDQPEVAVVAAAAKAVLSRWDERVRHYQVASSAQ